MRGIKTQGTSFPVGKVEFIDLYPLSFSEFMLAMGREQYNEVREIQARILDAYEHDFSKHAPNEVVPRIRMLWNSIPSQLTKENKKFIYGLIKEGARAKYRKEDWLINLPLYAIGSNIVIGAIDCT